jgi:hypothetical protein
VTDVPTLPDWGLRPVMLGTAPTVKKMPLLEMPSTVTTTGPEVAPLGTGTTIEFATQEDGDAVTPLNVTVLTPCEEPKLLPLIVTDVPTGPIVGESPERTGTIRTQNWKLLLLGNPPTVTTTLRQPPAAPAGTTATMEVAVQLVGVARVPPKVTVLDPSVDPKFEPLIVTAVPTGPPEGEMFVITGAVVPTAK